MMETVSSTIEIAAGPEDILGVLTDFEAYPEWARGVKSVEIRSRDDSGRPLEVEYEVHPGPMPKVRYVLRYSYAPGGIAWDYVEGDVKDLRGSYELEGRNGTTSVEYHLAIEPGKIRLPGFVKARAAREITRIALEELKRRVEAGT